MTKDEALKIAIERLEKSNFELNEVGGMIIEYILCYSIAFILGFTTAMLVMWVSVVMFESKRK